ncbi:hypothetical protein GOP47_0021404 [Adiantum capillus-veneris]|uniref:Uncharacterized protein n=1 Tax=Adiantum capillus-veneris TaxID=13818 RepID=A0A9D4Z6X4_ADICA|nr:hypothetical protein GOP47_0021404 [Adiantum capillus-veneris]
MLQWLAITATADRSEFFGALKQGAGMDDEEFLSSLSPQQRQWPDWLAKEDWKNAKKVARENPDKWKQQKDAATARVEAGSSHHLGSGGWASFEADFWSMTGRGPTPYEREYAGRKGLNALMDILTSRGGMNPTNTPQFIFPINSLCL